MAIMDYLPQFKDNTQDVSGLPANDTLAQLELQRKLKLADALKNAQAPQGQMISGHYVAPSFTQQLANAYGMYKGKKAEEEAIKNYGEYQKTKSSQLGDVLKSLETRTEDVPLDTVQTGGMPGMWETQTIKPDINKTIELMNTYDPSFGAKLAENKIAKALMPKEPIKLGKEDVLLDPTTFKPVYQGTTTNLGKVELDKFTPVSIAKFTTSGNYADLEPTAKAESSIFGKIDPKDYTATSVNKFLQTKNYADLIANSKLNENKAPVGYVWGKPDASGNPTLVPLAGGPADKSVNPTENQSNAAAFADRMNAADKTISSLEGKYSPFKISIATSNKTSMIPGGTALANAALGENEQKVEQAQREFINAILRRESGAAISPSEFESYSREYFPEPNDLPGKIQQKREARARAIAGLNKAAGPVSNKPTQNNIVNFEDLK